MLFDFSIIPFTKLLFAWRATSALEIVSVQYKLHNGAQIVFMTSGTHVSPSNDSPHSCFILLLITLFSVGLELMWPVE